MTTSLPIYFSLLGMSLVVVAGTPWVMPILAMVGTSGLNYINEIHPINKVCFRKFDAPLFSPFSHEYISYYEAKEEDKKEYPSSSIHEKKVHYTNAQTSFFLDFIDGVLSKENLSLLLKDYPSYQYSDAMYYLNSSKIQQDILARGDSGREIGNLSLPGEYGLEEATKFVEIEEIIRKNKGKTAIYSSYYQNGILLFAEFLRQKNYSFEVLRPDVGVEEITRILDNFNRGENKILLIHPEITEGISLIGVEQMHILEPVKNIALQKQIIGRSVRYQSHTLLPKDRRHVDIYLWESKVVYSELLWPTEAGLLRRDQWRKRFREVNPNLWTNGITQLDRQYFKKDETPDFRVNHLKDQIAGDMESFRQVATEHSLEKETAASNSFTVSSQLTSKFATPLIYFNVSKEQPYYLTTFNDSEEVFKMVRRTALDFDIEIPHSDTLSVGFGMRGSAGKIAKEYLGREISIGTFDLDLGFLTRTHYEIPTLRDLSVYWKNELDTGIFIYVPAIGLSLGVRESLGAQVFLTKHLGLSVEAGFEGKVMKDTIFSKIEDDDGSKLEDSSALFKQISTMKTLHPFIAVGVFSTYF